MSRFKIETAHARLGCWVDGVLGHYAITAVIREAIDYGMTVGLDDRQAVGAYDHGESTGEQDQAVAELADLAEDWLNANVAPDGYAFGWHEGSFYLWPYTSWRDDIEEWEEA